MADIFDVTPYLSVPQVDVPGAIALATALMSAKPKDVPDFVANAAKDVKKASAELMVAWQTRTLKPGKAEDPRLTDRGVDVSWSALFYRLDSLATLPSDRYPRAKLAAEVRDRIFPADEGLTFLKMPYRSQWAEVKRRLDRIDHEGLVGAIEDLAGAEHLSEIRRMFELYGAVLGITRPPPNEAQVENLLDRLRALTDAIGDYCIKMLATVDRKNPDSAEVVTAALKPILDARASTTRARGSEGSDNGGGDQDAGNGPAGEAPPG